MNDEKPRESKRATGPEETIERMRATSRQNPRVGERARAVMQTRCEERATRNEEANVEMRTIEHVQSIPHK